MKKLLLGLVLVAACVDSKAPIDDDVTAAFTADQKADLPTNTKFLGRINTDGMPSASLYYSSRPRYRSVMFGGVAGDDVIIDVTSTDGDAVAWLLDFQGNVIASNDDASSDTLDARIITTLTASNGNYYLYFRNYERAKAHFTITATGGHPADEAGDAERAYDAAIDQLDSLKVTRTALPAAAKTRFDKWVTAFSFANAYHLGGNYVVQTAAEETYFVDVYGADGHFIVHGANGDGGPEITFWGPPQPWDGSEN